VAREGAGRAVHGGLERRQWSSTAAAALCLGKEEESEWAAKEGRSNLASRLNRQCSTARCTARRSMASRERGSGPAGCRAEEKPKEQNMAARADKSSRRGLLDVQRG
jgi:hypothetical protein